MTKKEMIEKLKTKIASDDRWAVRALMFVYDRQTADEKQAHETREHNCVGFTGADAEFLSSLAKQSLRRPLSEKQLAFVKRKMPCYAAQIIRLNDPERIEAALH